MSVSSTFWLRGITCVTCAKRIEQRLRTLPSVAGVRVHVGLERVRVDHDPGKVSIEQLANEIETLGFLVLHGGGQLEENGAIASEQAARLRLLVGVVLIAPMMLAMVLELVGVSGAHTAVPPWMQAILATIVQGWLGTTIYRGAIRALRQRTVNMDVLIALATTVMYVASWVALGSGGTVYFETSAALIVFILLGKQIEQRMKKTATATLRALLRNDQRSVTIERGEDTATVPAIAIRQGDVVVVEPGMWVPVDGVIVSGLTHLDESARTGESAPVYRSVGDSVFAATINQLGTIRVQATTAGDDTTFMRMMHIVEQAMMSPMVRLADQIAARFIPLVLILTAGTGLFWWWQVDASVALERALAVLVMACPCALGLAIPLTLSVAHGRAIQRGILFHRAEAIERLAAIDTIVFDKTGTVTAGTFAFQAVHRCDQAEPVCSEETMWALVWAVEQGAPHGIGKTLAEEAQERTALRWQAPAQTLPGLGAETIVEGWRVRIGSLAWIAPTATNVDDVAEWEQNGWSIVALEVQGRLTALFALADTAKPEAQTVVATLHKQGLAVHLLTGDRQSIGNRIAKEIGIDAVVAEAVPEQKMNYIRHVQNEGRTVAMVGDGINDVPALAIADVGMALAHASDVAKEAASVTVMRSDLGAIVDAIVISRQTRYHVRVSLTWAFLYNGLGLPLAMLGYLSPMLAGMAMVCSSLSVVGYAAYVKRRSRFSHESGALQNRAVQIQ